MLTLVYLLNKKTITYAHITIIALIIMIAGYISPYILLFCIIDIYILLALTHFNVLKPTSKASTGGLKMDITTEGMEKDNPNVSSILSDYITKFN
tara:strand:- start:1964 stop:2248 length:285 start_codon:yes stop_codon:yes gene_type:complete